MACLIFKVQVLGVANIPAIIPKYGFFMKIKDQCLGLIGGRLANKVLNLFFKSILEIFRNCWLISGFEEKKSQLEPAWGKSRLFISHRGVFEVLLDIVALAALYLRQFKNLSLLKHRGN